MQNNPYEFSLFNSWSAANRWNGSMIYALLLNCSSFFSQRMAPWRPNFPHQRLLVCPVSSKESKNEQGPQGTCVLNKSDTKARVEARGWVGSIEDRPAKARASRGKLHSKRQTRRTTVVPKRKNPPKIDSHKVSSRVFQVSANSNNFRFRLLHEPKIKGVLIQKSLLDNQNPGFCMG